VRDLDLVRDGAWPQALRHLAGDPELRRALTEPVRVSDVDGRGGRTAASYTAWWLQRELGTVGLLDPGASRGLGGLLDAAPDWLAGLDDGTRRALGLVSGLGAEGAADPSLAAVLLQRLGDPARDVDAATCLRAWAVIGACAAELDADVRHHDACVRVLDGAGTTVVPASRAVVADDARWLQRVDLGGLVVVAAEHAGALADLLDVPLAGELAPGQVTSQGTPADVPGQVPAMLAGAAATWFEHDELLVDGHEVDWWVEQGRVHASTSDGLARALAFAGGDWAARHAVAAVLQQPADVVRLMVEDAAG